jgi:uncharacterized membrane protein
VAAAIRIGLAVRPGLWGDEVFSLAIATGHSLEHSPAEADPARGDFVEPRDARPAAEFRRYLRHDDRPAGPARVVRAVLLSDTNPPLYYLLLNGWTRLLGTGDAVLQLFSTLWALACFPLVAAIGRRVGGSGAALSACMLFAIAPPSLYYAVEGRMYSLVWLLALLLAWATLELGRRGARLGLLLLWTVAGAAGLLTHYFFVFAWLACAGWLLARPGRAGRGTVVAGVALSTILVLPWYVHLPESLGRWRVTAAWLAVSPAWHEALAAPLVLVWSLLSGRGLWGGSRWADRLSFALFIVLAGLIWKRGRWRELLRRTGLLWAWVLAACLGPSVLDLLRHTASALISRYALPALPAGMLLAGAGIATLRRNERVAFLLAVLVLYVPGTWDIVSHPAPPSAPYREANAVLASWTRPSDVVIVHSIPSGVLATARYARTAVPLASWIIQLERRRVPDDLLRLLAGRSGVALLEIHDLNEPSPAEAWLRENARLVREKHWRSAPYRFADAFYFVPAHGQTFFADSGGGSLR